MNLLMVFSIFFAVRLASVFIVRTYYVPDEYWQSLEVAHKITFGYGYLTWEWIEGIRSYIYPLLIAGLYKILALLTFDNVNYLVLLPRILQSLLSAFADYRFFVWTGKKKWSIFLIITSWFWFYTGSRTLANTLETSLSTIAFSYYPWHLQTHGKLQESTSYLWLAALSCFVRPTAAIIWLPLTVYHLKSSKFSIIELIVKRFLLIGILVGGVCVAIDSYAHGKFIVTPYEFLKYNIIHSIGTFYGSHPWYWYFSVGLPTILGINFLPFLFATIETIRNQKVFPIRKCILITILIALAAFSAIEHKEFRFVLPVLPLCLYICVDALSRWSYKLSKSFIWIIVSIIIAGNAVPAWYLSTVHNRGPIDLMPKLHDIAVNYKYEGTHRANIIFLMPCHSTPYFSHIHENITMKFLTCEPPIKGSKDEADEFYNSPESYLRRHIPVHPKSAKPSHIVIFDSLATKINEFLSDYYIKYTIPNTEYVMDKRTGTNILVYERNESKTNENELPIIEEQPTIESNYMEDDEYLN